MLNLNLNHKSRMRLEFHVRFCERWGGKFPLPTRPSGYYRQSEVENMFYRYKTLLGDQLRARGENSRQVEAVLACNILNRFSLLGRPQCELVT